MVAVDHKRKGVELLGCQCVKVRISGLFHPNIPHLSGQIIATSHDLTPNGSSVREIPLYISGKSRLVKYHNLARFTSRL